MATKIDRWTELTCQHCVHFADDPAVIEAEIPGLTSFGSAYSSARGYAGICREFDRFMDPVMAWNCGSFEARGTSSTAPVTAQSKQHSRLRDKE